MNTWKEARALARFEFKSSWSKRITLLIFTTLLILFIMISSFQSYFDNSNMGIDVFFIILIGYSYMWSIPKGFQYEKVSEHTYVSPVFIFMHQLPIKNEVLIKSRFYIFLMQLIPFLVVVMSLLYLSPELRSVLDVSSFIAFVILWVSFGVAFGAIFPASDLGDHNVTTERIIVYSAVFLIIFSTVFAVVYITYGEGIIHFTTYLADKWPVQTAIISIVVAITSVIGWLKAALRKIEKVDFLT
ncbi:hypothetical protein [Tenuibacillus multivorans]|uniref:ABC-2 family transporter protein n=1 Tax=Tenuibacillus multivorans TaxID=237069 RepID=A0A1G9WEV1_9BACI|nr:hypothetical protein [Tenuibacillus multivorans]GEL76423.1 hypothetical protein TMU01_06580 [Tenuibacillus multivorans]SDM82827.1 hypothetical protein SAMN05216498_0712 [Tenuibacillus multivorans]